jgi:predicted dehydrogenase
MRFAVIGCGWITGALHAPSYAQIMREQGGLEAAACCDVDAARAEQTRARFGFGRAYTDPLRLLAEERLDAVCLNVPPALTCELACAVLRRGIALLTEKPPGLTTAELEQMIAAAEAGGAAHMVAFNRRWMPLARELRARLGDRPVEHVQYSMVRAGRRDADFSTTAVHAVDAASFLAGSAYRALRIGYQELPEEGPGAANFYLDAEMVGGAQVRIAATPLAGATIERALVAARGWSADLRCPVGNDGAGRLEIYAGGKPEAVVEGAACADGNEEWRLGGFYQENQAFFNALLAGERPPDGLESARQAVAIMQALRERRAEVVFAP